ncbi:MAG: 50S ribosome-binding GTPase [Anaerolineae bacterium]|nr:50S ribosome-binding GTPase [Anaerolineae bacterium]
MSESNQALHPMCDGCARAQLIKMGINSGKWHFAVALAGNPNTGKSTVFNALTGLRQHTGNWPGKTVTRMEGLYKYGEYVYKLVDLPGTYSLLATSEDEEIARNFILFGRPDVTVVVVDATRLERNLNLAYQVMEIADRVVIDLNLIDEAERHGLEISARQLSRELGVPVVPTAARNGRGIDDLIKIVSDMATGQLISRPNRLKVYDSQFGQAVGEVTRSIESLYPGLPNARWVAIRLLDGDERIEKAVRTGELLNMVRGQNGDPAFALQGTAA